MWTLIAIQIVMGVFDTFYHHEFTERLAWRPSQRFELKLHGIRNMLYALLFLVLGWLEVHGALALLIVAVLVAEIVITLMDFVEEDLSRKLPPSERVNHTLLAINYGAILVLLLPVLIDWATQPLGVMVVYQGLLSIAATACAVGAALCGVRDFAAMRRLSRMRSAPAHGLVEKLSGRKTVLISGATGFIGSRLAASLSGAGHHVIALIRNPAKAEMLPPPVTLITSLDQIASDAPVDAVVNLAGEPIGNGLWTEAKRAKILGSRIDMTGEIVKLIARLERKPEVLVSGSAIGWYGLWADQVLTESAKSHACFSHELCAAGGGPRRPRGQFAHRPRARHRRRLRHALADAVRVRARRSHRQRAAVDVLDRARRSDPADRLCDGDARSRRPRQRHRADPRHQRKVQRGARPPSASARGVPDSRRPAAPDRRRFRRRAPARRSARAAQQGAKPRFCVPARDAAQCVRSNLVKPCGVRSPPRSGMLPRLRAAPPAWRDR
jgi:hypothetical protein